MTGMSISSTGEIRLDAQVETGALLFDMGP